MSQRVHTKLKPPFPWFGSKKPVIDVVWSRFGKVKNFVDPFFGGGAMLLGSPYVPRTETVNDLNGYISNFFRALQAAPEKVAKWADWPVNENDKTARHAWLLERRTELASRLEGDPEYYNAKIAGWWVWGLCIQIGSGWCSGNGPWIREKDEDGVYRIVKKQKNDNGDGLSLQMPAMASQGLGRRDLRPGGIKRDRPELGHKGINRRQTEQEGFNKKLPILGGGTGVNRRSVQDGISKDMVDMSTRGVIRADANEHLVQWFQRLSTRLRNVRVCCGDWARICGPSPTIHMGLTAVFLDPPYGGDEERCETYSDDSLTVANDVRAWCAEQGSDKRLRIALCGYQGEHESLEKKGWAVLKWKASGGYGNQGKGDEESVGRKNARRERIWFSPHCLAGDFQKGATEFLAMD